MYVHDLVYNLAREHKAVKGYYYGRAELKGAGTDRYPLVWLNDPVSGTNVNGREILRLNANVDILGIPANEADVARVQHLAFFIGIEFAEQIRKTSTPKGVLNTMSYDWITLSNYTDDKAAGVRFTFHLDALNPINLCADMFDPAKQFEEREGLLNFKTDDPTGCAVFGKSGVLPNFELSI